MAGKSDPKNNERSAEETERIREPHKDMAKRSTAVADISASKLEEIAADLSDAITLDQMSCGLS